MILFACFAKCCQQPRSYSFVVLSISVNAVFQIVHIQTMEEAQNAPSPFTTFSLFYDGQLVTHEILSEKKFDKILTEKGL